MCGIVGSIGNLSKNRENAILELLMVDSLRGHHSTGVITVDYRKVSTIRKSLGNGMTFVSQLPQFFLSGVKTLIGHNRLATRGGVSEVTAHPFRHGKFSGVHNGTLENQSLLPDHQNFPVDSENIYYSMSRIGEVPTLERLDGAYALAWFNEEDGTVNLARNTERPLHYCLTKDKKNLFYASEELMLAWILKRNFIEHEPIKMVPAGLIHTFTLPNYDAVVEDPVKTPFKIYKKPSFFNTNKEVLRLPANGNVQKFIPGHRRKMKKNEIGDYLELELPFYIGEKVADEQGTFYIELFPMGSDIEINNKLMDVRCYYSTDFPRILEERDKGNIVMAPLVNFVYDKHKAVPYVIANGCALTFVPEPTSKKLDKETFYVGYQGRVLNEDEYKKATKNGCCWCSEQADPSVTNIFVSDTEFVCPDCAKEPGTLDYLEMAGYATRYTH